MNYQNKNILITGAYQGIGKALVDFFIKEKAHLIITYHNHLEETKKVQEEIEKREKLQIDLVYLDLQNEQSIQEAFHYIKQKYGNLDILINNASLSLDNYYMDKTKKEFMKVLEVNILGTFLMIKYFSEIMHKGYIFNISSTDGIDTGNVYSIDYNVSKAGINILTKTISLDSDNTIISLCPNWVDTESTCLMDANYLKEEMKRVNQKELIKKETIAKVIDECIKRKTPSGSIIRIEGDKEWMN